MEWNKTQEIADWYKMKQSTNNWNTKIKRNEMKWNKTEHKGLEWNAMELNGLN